ncbi:hypothetical protein Drorol1_Dr00011007, partial [Drosera rotundifolia]
MSQKSIMLRHLQARIPVRSLEFNFTSFEPRGQNITYENDAFVSTGVIQLTKNQQDGTLIDSVGRASYSHPSQLWDPVTGNLTDFTTHVTFIIKQVNSSGYGDGLAFFLGPSMLPHQITLLVAPSVFSAPDKLPLASVRIRPFYTAQTLN